MGGGPRMGMGGGHGRPQPPVVLPPGRRRRRATAVRPAAEHLQVQIDRLQAQLNRAGAARRREATPSDARRRRDRPCARAATMPRRRRLTPRRLRKLRLRRRRRVREVERDDGLMTRAGEERAFARATAEQAAAAASSASESGSSLNATHGRADAGAASCGRAPPTMEAHRRAHTRPAAGGGAALGRRTGAPRAVLARRRPDSHSRLDAPCWPVALAATWRMAQEVQRSIEPDFPRVVERAARCSTFSFVERVRTPAFWYARTRFEGEVGLALQRDQLHPVERVHLLYSFGAPSATRRRSATNSMYSAIIPRVHADQVDRAAPRRRTPSRARPRRR